VIGLGNPGEKYQQTRHNLGFMVIDEIAKTYSIPFKTKFDAAYGQGIIQGHKVILAKPLAFMNRSGIPTIKLANYYDLSCKDLIVIHDDIDLAFGRLKIKEKGGDGGHKGIRSLIDAFGGNNFSRVRIGIGRSEADINVADYVLGRFTHAEKAVLDQILTVAQNAVVTILCKGTKEGMNRFNNKNMILN
jgi:PTH1 family peptidyl-tRNA hydrolase